MKKNTKLLSVIVPAYRQARSIEKDLLQIKRALQEVNCEYEIICVVDGQSGPRDRTLKIAQSLSRRHPEITAIGYRDNRGKGYAVRYGMARAKGDPIAFIDSGMDINPQAILMLLVHLEWYDSDVIVGSVRHSASKVVGYPFVRKIYSWGYHNLTKLMFGLKITDSQRGVKIFRRRVLEKVLPRLLVKKFAFDIEMLAVAKHLGFKKIHDGPVIMDATRMRYSSVRHRTVISMFQDTLAVWYRLYVKRYYDDGNRRRWFYDPDLEMKVNLP